MGDDRAAPDYVEPFVAWKGLTADAEGLLRSPMGTEWPAGEPLVAVCLHKGHTPPVTKCMCGVYGVKTFNDLRGHDYNWGEEDEDGVWVVAEISLWGRVRPGRIGYRAQFAYPKKVYVPAYKIALGTLIKTRYEVELGIIDRFTGRRM